MWIKTNFLVQTVRKRSITSLLFSYFNHKCHDNANIVSHEQECQENFRRFELVIEEKNPTG